MPGFVPFVPVTSAGDRVRIFEVDHPATQAWKRERLAGAGIRIPESLALAPIGFERQSLAEGLSSAGFDSIQQTFFTWLGVVPYLKQEAVFSTLAFIGSLANGAHVVFEMKHDLARMIPAFFPQRLWLVYITGVLEVLSAVGLMLHQFRRLAGVSIILLLVGMSSAVRRGAVSSVNLAVGDMQSPLVRP
jgi:hypothetical protein